MTDYSKSPQCLEFFGSCGDDSWEKEGQTLPDNDSVSIKHNKI